MAYGRGKFTFQMFITGYICVCVYLFHYLFFINSNHEDLLKKAHQLQEMVGLALSTSELAIQFGNTVF